MVQASAEQVREEAGAPRHLQPWLVVQLPGLSAHLDLGLVFLLDGKLGPALRLAGVEEVPPVCRVPSGSPNQR